MPNFTMEKKQQILVNYFRKLIWLLGLLDAHRVFLCNIIIA